mgnify:CR=1 FL=1
MTGALFVVVLLSLLPQPFGDRFCELRTLMSGIAEHPDDIVGGGHCSSIRRSRAISAFARASSVNAATAMS